MVVPAASAHVKAPVAGAGSAGRSQGATALILRRHVRAWMLFNLAEVTELGEWRPCEWNDAVMVIDLIDDASERLSGV